MRGFCTMGYAGIARRAVMPFPCFVSMVALVLFGLLYCAPRDVAYAQSAPQASKVGAMVLELVLEKQEQLGYKALDSIVQATTNAVSGEMGLLAQVAAQTESASLGSVVSATEFGAILDATAATPAGIALSLLFQPTALGDDSLVKWQQGHGAGVLSVTVIPQFGGHWQYYQVGLYAQPFNQNNPSFVTENFTSLGDAATAWMDNQNQFIHYEAGLSPCSNGSSCDGEFTSVNSCNDGYSDGSVACTFSGSFLAGVTKSFQQTEFMATGMNGTPSALQPGGQFSGTTSSMTVDQALTSLPASEQSRPLNPQLLADLADALWNQAAQQSGYSGVPYPSSNPITSSDVSTSEGSHPTLSPTVGDLVSPVAVPAPGTNPSGGTNPTGGTNPASGTSPSGGTGSSGGTNPTGGTDPASGTQPSSGTTPTGGGGPTNDATENLCQQDPGIVACQGLGAPPNAPTLPSSSATVSLSPVPVGGPANPVCPLPASVNVLGYTLTFSYQPQCDFMVRVKPFMLAMCGVIAAGIFIAGLKS